MLMLLRELGILWLLLWLLVVARVVSPEPFVEACKGHATLALPVLLQMSFAAVVNVLDGVAVEGTVVFVGAVAVDAAVSPVAVPTILLPPPLLSNQRSCH